MPAHAVARKLPQADAYADAREQFDHIVAQLHAPETQLMTHSELENLIDSQGRELMRRLLQAHLDERGPGTTVHPVLGADSQHHSHLRLHTRHLETLFGTVELTRAGYGGRGLESLHPMDGELNLPDELFSLTLRQRIAQLAAKESFDEVVQTINTDTGAKVGKRQVEELTVRAAEDFETFYKTQPQASCDEVETTGEVLIISADSKGVPVRRQDLRPATQAAASERKPRLSHRRSKGEKGHTKRMATVAAVYTISPWVRTAAQIIGELDGEELIQNRPRPEDKRVWASVKQRPEEVITQAMEEALRRDPQQVKHWVALVDGAPSQLSLLKETAKKFAVDVTIILDLIHVLEYLWKASWALHPEADPAAEQWVTHRLEEILLGHSSEVAAGMRRSATLRGLKAKHREPIDKCADYLLKYREYLRYDKYLESGFPVATGVIEGACRYVVKDRMEKTGARWRLESAEAVLRLRALRASGDFDEYWEYHLKQEYKRNHTIHYADGQVPQVLHEIAGEEKTPHLRLVK
jgi:hypothetical protein